MKPKLTIEALMEEANCFFNEAERNSDMKYNV
jgi:hypothetical protein